MRSRLRVTLCSRLSRNWATLLSRPLVACEAFALTLAFAFELFLVVRLALFFERDFAFDLLAAFGAAFLALAFAFDFVGFLAFDDFDFLLLAFFSAIWGDLRIGGRWVEVDPTISIPQGVWPGGKETCLHRCMVGEPQRPPVERQLPLLGGPGPRRIQHLEAANEDVVDRGGAGRRPAHPELVAQSFEDARLLGRAEVEIAAEEEWRAARPLERRPRRLGHVLGRQIRPVVGRVQVGDADARGGADEAHRSPLRLAFVDRDLAPLGDAAELAGDPDQDQVRAALAGGHEVGVLPRQQPAQGAEPVARGEGPVPLRPAGAGQRLGKARRHLLQHRHVPLGLGEHRRERHCEVAIDLDVGLVALGEAQQPRAPGAQLRVGRMVAPVEEIPAQCGQLHARSISSLKRDFLTGEELGAFELSKLLDRAAELKAGRRDGVGADSLAGRSIALVFERPSTRTRISFDVGVAELSAHPVVLRGDEMQLSRGESPTDTARVLSRYVDAIVIRSGSHDVVAALAEAAEVPVINGLTPLHHPCQALADLLTMRERFGDLQGLRLAYVGDGNNVARSLAILGRTAGVEVVVASPEGYRIEEGIAELVDEPIAAVAGADAVYTDVWVSMGDEEQADRRRADLAPYQLNDQLLASASERAVALHCLPAHPGEEITEEVLYGERSAVWDQAENRSEERRVGKECRSRWS